MTVTVVDLFAGAGGLSTGLVAAGAQVVLAVEAREDASATYAENHRAVAVVNATIDQDWRAPLCASPDIVAGGPPCQGWSTLGHRGGAERRERHNAAIDLFLQQVKLLKPRAVLLENVRGLAVAARGQRLAAIESHLEDLGYTTVSKLVRACDYGVPQLRHRLFVVGIRRDVGFSFAFPKGKGNGALVTFHDAVSDLPRLRPGETNRSYASSPQNFFQRRIRGGCSSLEHHHAPAHPPHILRLLAALPQEGGTVRDLPEALRPRSGFHNTYARLRSNAPAPAVTSSIGRVSSGPHVHPTQDRALTVREAARLQTFKDSYVWKGPGRWALYELVGNAVPPLLAERIARPLVAALDATG